jgi:hypothetical protein
MTGSVWAFDYPLGTSIQYFYAILPGWEEMSERRSYPVVRTFFHGPYLHDVPTIKTQRQIREWLVANSLSSPTSR